MGFWHFCGFLIVYCMSRSWRKTGWICWKHKEWMELMEQENPASFSALEHSAVKHSMCLLLKQKKCCAELFISEVAHFHHLSSLSFFVQYLCSSLFNTHPFSSSILILTTASRLPAFTACAISDHYRARKLCESSAQQAVRTLSHATESHALRPFSWIRKYQKSNQKSNQPYV